jgi:cytochrome P450
VTSSESHAGEASVGTPDWRRDLDILDARYVTDPAPIWSQLRGGQCPVAFSERYGRSWMPVNFDDVAEIAGDPATFSSRRVGVIDPPPRPDRPTTPLTAPPITSDPPEHTAACRVLLPAFSPRQIDVLTPITRRVADELLDDLVTRGSGDAARDYAQHIPVRVIAHMLGVPASDEDMFTDWTVRILQQGFYDIAGSQEAVRQTLAYFAERLEERVSTPASRRPDDLITLLIETEIDGSPLDRKHVLGSCFLLLIAGIDTTWSAIGSSLWHLATHPDDQRRLRDDPDLISSAVEEVLRFYSPVTMAREVVADATVAGCPMRAGDKVLLAFPAANRDPQLFDEPDTFRIDRGHNRHVAFGKGIHRCLGSNLARMELRVALEAWLRRIPTFELVQPSDVSWTAGQVRGPRCVPVHWS